MPRGPTAQVLVTRFAGAASRPERGPDRVIVEEPLEIRLNGHPVGTTMRTPGHDFELAAGFLLAEGVLGPTTVTTVRYCAGTPARAGDFNTVDVRTTTTTTGPPPPAPPARLTTATSACGLCGSTTLAALAARLRPVTTTVTAERPILAALPARARARQDLFSATGSVHAAAAFDPTTGDLVVVREDIGRHNAVDKVAGAFVLARRPGLGAGLGLFVSGRASFEMVQKAWAAGFGLVAAVSGPSSLAIEAAGTAGITLVGFLRGNAMNVYPPR
ncbi:MAG: formate dehydrogenase accessory sulfurtransferase FdhD [Acidimicrobiales bacterium]